MSGRHGFFRPSIIIGICFDLLLILFSIGATSRKNQVEELDVPTPYPSDREVPLFANPSPSATGAFFQVSSIIQPTPNFSTPSTSVCADIWGMDPPAELPAWLGTPQNIYDLNTELK